MFCTDEHEFCVKNTVAVVSCVTGWFTVYCTFLKAFEFVLSHIYFPDIFIVFQFYDQK